MDPTPFPLSQRLQQINDELKTLRDVIGELDIALRRDLLTSLQRRVDALEAGLAANHRETRALYESRIWRILCWGGKLCLPVQWMLPARSRLPADVLASPANLEQGTQGALTDEVLITCDHPNPQVTTTVQDLLVIRGWAIAKSGIARVVVRINDGTAAEATYGIHRPDVAAHYPDFPASGHSGFQFVWNPAEGSTALSSIRITAISNGGLSKDVSCRVLAETRLQQHDRRTSVNSAAATNTEDSRAAYPQNTAVDRKAAAAQPCAPSAVVASKKARVAFICQPEYFQWLYEDDLDSLYQVRSFRMLYDMSKEDYRDLLLFDADVNIFFRGEFVPDGVVPELRGQTICLSSEPFPTYHKGRLSYTLDSLGRLRSFLEALNKGFDYIFHYDPASSAVLEKIGVHLSGFFYFPVATGTYRPAVTEKKYDFLFTGRSTPHREHLFGRLKHHFNVLHIVHGVFGRDLLPYIHQARILLNAHAEPEVSWEPRVQLYMAAGGFVMSEEISENPYLLPGEHYVEFAGEADLFEKATYYLQKPEEREAIAASGLVRTREVFSAEKCFHELIQNVLEGRYRTPYASVRQDYLDILELCATYPNQEFDHLLTVFQGG